MAENHLLSALLLVITVLLFIQTEAVEYSCMVDNTTTYQFPSCNLRSSSSDSVASPPPEENSDHHHHTPGYDQELETMATMAPPPLEDPRSSPPPPHPPAPRPTPPRPEPCEVSKPAISLLKCCWKFEYVRIHYLAATMGQQLSDMDPSLVMNGTSKGGQKAIMSADMEQVVESIAYASMDQMRTLKGSIGMNDSVQGFDVDIGRSRCASLFDKAWGASLVPKFDCYKDDIHVLLTLYWFNALATKCYVGILDRMEGPKAKRLCGSLAAAKASQEVLIRSKLFEVMHAPVHPYFFTIAEATNRMSLYADSLMNTTGCSEEGLDVPQCLSTGGYNANMFSLDDKGLPYGMVVDSFCAAANETLSDFMGAHPQY